jgi:hypothetical protein
MWLNPRKEGLKIIYPRSKTDYYYLILKFHNRKNKYSKISVPLVELS